MENQIERPLSVCIAQVLLALLAINNLWFTFYFSLAFKYRYWYRGIPVMIIMLLISALPVTAFLGMAQRRPYGRSLGVGILSVLLIFFTFVRLFEPFGTVFSEVMRESTLSQIFISVLTFGVILHITFSEKASAFFTRFTARTLEPHPKKSD